MYFFTLFLSHDSGLEINILLVSMSFILDIFSVDFFVSEIYCSFTHFIYGKEKK